MDLDVFDCSVIMKRNPSKLRRFHFLLFKVYLKVSTYLYSPERIFCILLLELWKSLLRTWNPWVFEFSEEILICNSKIHPCLLKRNAVYFFQELKLFFQLLLCSILVFVKLSRFVFQLCIDFFSLREHCVVDETRATKCLV